MNMKIPPIGSLRHRVQLLNKIMSSDNAGGHEVSYVHLANVWANIRSNNGIITQMADANISALTHIIIIRYRNDINIGDRIIYEGRIFEIISLNDLNGYRAYLQCFCSEQIVRG